MWLALEEGGWRLLRDTLSSCSRERQHFGTHASPRMRAARRLIFHSITLPYHIRSPMFVLPIFKGPNAFETILVQCQMPCMLFTSLEEYKLCAGGVVFEGGRRGCAGRGQAGSRLAIPFCRKLNRMSFVIAIRPPLPSLLAARDLWRRPL